MLQIYKQGECGSYNWVGLQSTVEDCWNEIKSRSSECDQTYFLYVARGDGNCGCIQIGTDCTDSNNLKLSSIDIMEVVNVQAGK